MKQAQDSDWIPVSVATTLPLLAALTSWRVSLPVTLVALLTMYVTYWRRSPMRAGAIIALPGAAVGAAAMVYLWMRGRR